MVTAVQGRIISVNNISSHNCVVYYLPFVSLNQIYN
jgi:hypothetical protein